MRSFGSIAALIALAVVLFAAAPRAQSAQAASLFKQATAREADLRKEIEATSASGQNADVITRMRTLAHTYEDLWRLFPTSPYSDDALWHGGMLAGDAFRQTGDSADRTLALRMFRALTSKFPTSSLVKRVPAEVSRLESAKATEIAATRAVAPPAPVATTPTAAASATLAARPTAIAPEASATRPAATSASAAVSTLRAIRREVLPDVLRVTLELEREPVFNSEQIDGPPRVFIDMQNTRASESLRDARLAYSSEVVQQIRVGRQLNGRIRVVFDLSGASRYSVYTLYNPFRIVVDFERKQAPAKPAVQQAAVQPSPAPATSPRPTPPPPVDAAKSRTVTEGPRASTETPQSTPPAALARAVPPPPAEVNKPRATTEAPRPPADAGRAASEAGRTATSSPPVAAAPPERRTTIGKGPEPGDAWPQPTMPAVTAASTTSAVKTETPKPAATAPVPPRPTAPPPSSSPSANSTGAYSLSRQLGLGIGRIVIDPGHGGHDPGAQVKGLSEAEITLDIALRLEKLFTKQPGVEVVLTRRTDAFVPLQERTAIANRAGADLFLSIHGNANDDVSLRGVETYFLNLSPNAEAGRIAARENATSSQTMHEFEDIVKAIALNDKIDESRDFAAIVQTSLYEKLRASNRDLKNLGVKQAPFVVLIGATMPSILAEISFLTNRQDAALLKTDKYRQQIAEALYQGVMRYQQSLKKAPAVASAR